MKAHEYKMTVQDEAGTMALASRLARSISAGMTVALNATLGAGKTRFVQAFCAASGIPDGVVVSPTYVICQEYQGDTFLVHHLDVYRLKSTDEFLDLGAEEMFAGPSVKLIEWAEQVAECLPDDRIDVSIEISGETRRTFIFRGTGPEAADIVAKLSCEETGERYIYKIVPTESWDVAMQTGRFEGSPIDLRDGYIHFSAEHQVVETAVKHFSGQVNLLLVTVDSKTLADALRWEVSRGGDRFPHLYGILMVHSVDKVEPLEEGLVRLKWNSD